MDQSTRKQRQTEGRENLRAGIASMSPAQPAQVLPREEPTPRLTLRALTEHDRDEFVELVTSSMFHLAPWIPSLARGQSGEEFFEAEFERTTAEEPRRRSFRRVGVVDDRIIGMFNLFNCCSGLTLQADVSWWVGRRFTQRGHATQGLRLLMRHAFADLPEGLGLHRVMAMIAPENTPSLKLARALGFRPFQQEDHYVQIGQAWKKHECWLADAIHPSLTEVKTPRGIDRPSLRSERE